MDVYYPSYYSAFQCIASACPDSCCKEWEVDVDDNAAQYYRSLEGALGDRLRQVLKDTDDGTVMTIERGRCPMWRQDGLCRIQAELGHDALCQTCREFPRLHHDYGDFVEHGLELSCPEAARLILSGDWELTKNEQPGGEEPEYDQEVMTILQESRKVILNFLTTTPLPANEALAVLLLYTYEVQNWIDGGEAAVLDVENCVKLAKKYATSGDFSLLIDFFKALEILTPQWRARLHAPGVNCNWDPRLLILVHYFIDRYWLQAVSDYDLICRVKFSIAACLVVHYLGGEFVETAQLFSKEIENDPDNLETILDGVYTSAALTDTHILSLLLNR